MINNAIYKIPASISKYEIKLQLIHYQFKQATSSSARNDKPGNWIFEIIFPMPKANQVHKEMGNKKN